MSYVQSLYHIVFSTYCRRPTITVEHERDLYAYIVGTTEKIGAKIVRIGGMPDHLHIFVSLPSTMSVANYVQSIKISSSHWLKGNPLFKNFNGWEHEYAAISYHFKDKGIVVNYIKNQKEHHKKLSFSEEYRAFLQELGLPIREEYLPKD